MPKIILELPEGKLIAELSLADVLRVKKIMDLGFDIDWREPDGKRMDQERD